MGFGRDHSLVWLGLNYLYRKETQLHIINRTDQTYIPPQSLIVSILLFIILPVNGPARLRDVQLYNIICVLGQITLPDGAVVLQDMGI